MSKRWPTYTALAFSLFACSPLNADPAKPAPPAADCPSAVKGTIARTFPKSTITKCKAEHEHGRDQFEVKIVKADGAKAEVDVAADGKILQIEEKVPVDKIPAAVMTAFAARYPKAKVDVAEKQTPAEGQPSYELGFSTDSGRKEATFTEDGKFVEEE
jgi:Putative beta-lactamase-inhibitor-like, PepSY-like